MIEYAVGPVVALLVAMKFSDFKSNQLAEKVIKLEQDIELVSTKVDGVDQEVLKKMLVTITPVAKAVKELQESIGVR